MYLSVTFVHFFYHLKMKTKTYIFYVCSGYIYGLLLIDLCQAFPAHNLEIRFEEQKTSPLTNMEVEKSKSNSLSMMDITTFIDEQSALLMDQDQKERSKRSANNPPGTNPFDEDFGLDYKTIQSLNFATNGLHSQSPHTFQNDQEGTHHHSSENDVPYQSISRSSTKIGPPGTDPSSFMHPRPSHGTPQYMLDLFARFQNDPFSQPASNIVRSFFNEATPSDQLSYDTAYVACIEERGFDRCPRVHHLQFDVSSVPQHEHVTMAELRLYKIVERDRRRYAGVNRKVEVVELIRAATPRFNVNKTNQDSTQRIILDSRRIIGRQSGWETFFITQAIRRWVKSGDSLIHEMEVYIENISGRTETNFVDFEQNPMTANEPLLVVFSDDTSNHHRLEHKEELQELLSHRINENEPAPPIGNPNIDIFQRHSDTHHEALREEEVLDRKKRSVYNPCHLERMYVDFEEIGYNNWIINPRGYPAGHCVGSCDFPFHRLSVSPHGVIQSQMHSRHASRFQQPCCVPTKLGPISLLYIEQSSLTYKYNYEGMQVLECGCR